MSHEHCAAVPFGVADGGAVVVGQEDGTEPDVLQTVGLRTITNLRCANLLGQVGIRVTKSMICAGSGNLASGGQDSCQVSAVVRVRVAIVPSLYASI